MDGFHTHGTHVVLCRHILACILNGEHIDCSARAWRCLRSCVKMSCPGIFRGVFAPFTHWIMRSNFYSFDSAPFISFCVGMFDDICFSCFIRCVSLFLNVAPSYLIFVGQIKTMKCQSWPKRYWIFQNIKTLIAEFGT